MKKTVALLLMLILLFTLSISALAYADGPTPEGGESQPGPQPEPAPVQPAGSGTGDAVRFSESVLNAPSIERTAGGTGVCDLGNGKTIYTILAETLKDWKSRGVKILTLHANGSLYTISLDDLLDCLNAEAGADSVHIKLDEDGLHLYAKPKEFGGVNRVDIATLQPVAEQPAAEQSSAVRPEAQTEQEREPLHDLILEELANQFDKNGRPLFTYEVKDDGTWEGNYRRSSDEEGYALAGRIKCTKIGQERQHVDEKYDTKDNAGNKTTMSVTKQYENGKLMKVERVVRTASGTIRRTETFHYNMDGTGPILDGATYYPDNSKEKWDDLYQTDPGVRHIIDMMYKGNELDQRETD